MHAGVHTGVHTGVLMYILVVVGDTLACILVVVVVGSTRRTLVRAYYILVDTSIMTDLQWISYR